MHSFCCCVKDSVDNSNSGDNSNTIINGTAKKNIINEQPKLADINLNDKFNGNNMIHNQPKVNNEIDSEIFTFLLQNFENVNLRRKY
ncbi:hypothetical protein I4U23_006477 [Adineta vaga]|nr:hypothetical protein I4U23_006477 [Adineta vaga]